MKRAALLTFTLFLLAIIHSSCKDDIYIDWKLANERWYAQHKSDPGFITTKSGLCYKVIHQGYQRHPDLNSQILVRYTGTLIDGTVFESDTAKLYLAQTIKGWQEGIQKMQDGGNYIFYIPSALAYDTATTNANIPPYSVLRFDVELLESR
ncbi:MAG: FKBP-type peptidyl-prolyl cis-trans isomerase [Paludibacter sp.]